MMNKQQNAYLKIATALVVGFFSGPTWAATFYWGGGTTDIADGTPLPTNLDNLSGNWNTTVKNWATDTSGTTYQTWDNSQGANNVADFGYGLTAGSVTATVTLGESLNLNRLFVEDNRTNRGFTFTASSAVNLTFDGANPWLGLTNPGANAGQSITFNNNVRLAGSNGLTLANTYTAAPNANSLITISSDSSALTGTLKVDSSVQQTDVVLSSTGKLAGISTLLLTGNSSLKLVTFTASTTGTGTQTQFASEAIIKGNAGSIALFTYTSNAHATTPSSQTVGKLVLEPYLRLGVSANNGSGTNYGTLTFNDATSGIDRGSDGKGTLQVTTDTSGVLHTNIVVSNGVATGQVLPWMVTISSNGTTNGNGYPLQLNAGTKQLETVATVSAPTDLSTWAGQGYGSSTYLRYDSTTAPTNATTADVTVGTFSLAAPQTGAQSCTLGANLTIDRGLLSLYSPGGTKTLTGGAIASGTSELYVFTNQNGGGTAVINSVIKDGASNMDLIYSGGATLTLGGPSANTYTGTTYVAGSLALSKTSGVAIPGNLVIQTGGVVNESAGNNIASTSDVTIRSGGKLSLSTFNQTFGGVVTINGGTLDMTTGTVVFNNAGTGLAFNGGTLTATAAKDLQTNVSYAASSTTQALISGSGGSLRLINGAGSVNRTFDIADSSTLAAGTSEMKISIPLTNTTGTASLTKSGTGTLELTGLSTYGGGTIINAGKLLAGHNNALGTGTVTINSGGTLESAAGISIGNAITLNSGGAYVRVLAGGTAYNTYSSTFSQGLGTQLSLLDGSASASTTLSSTWRARNASEGDVTTPGTTPPLPGGAYDLISDVVSFTGTGSDLYVLQLSYDPSQIYNIGYGENNLVTNGLLYLSYLNAGTYENGILGNTGNNATGAQQKYLGTFAAFQTTYGTTLSNYIGAYGVDTTGNVAWAVVNHNSDWAVVPEPGTLALLAFGSLAVMKFHRKKNS